MNVYHHFNQEDTLTTGKAHLAPIGQKDVRAPEPVWTFWRKINLLLLPEIEIGSLITATITPSQIVTACVMQKHNKSELTVNSLFPQSRTDCLEIRAETGLIFSIQNLKKWIN